MSGACFNGRVQAARNARAASRQVNVRERLPRDVRRLLLITAWALGALGLALVLIVNIAFGGFGADSHAYWMAWRGPMYTAGPVTPNWTGPNPYLYSPAFAQALWPATQLPWPVFAAAFALMDAAVLAWLLRPVGWRWSVPTFFALLPEVTSSNIYIPLAAMCVLGFRYPSVWAFSALTKVAPTVMPVWWVVRREWGSLALWVGTTAVIVIVSVLIAPQLWMDWVSHMVSWAGESGRALGTEQMLPLLYRAPIGLLLLVIGARKDWRWTVPVAALFCTPVYWLGSFAWLAAIPRILRARRDELNACDYPGEANSARWPSG